MEETKIKLDFFTVACALESLSNVMFLSGTEVETAGDEILTNDESAASAIADFLETIGFEYVNYTYYDPDDDAREGIDDCRTGKWAVSVD